MGVGDAKQDSKALKAAQDQLATIAGQQPSVRRARKSIAAFKLREGMPVGVAVTLRGDRGYEFLDRLVSIAIPRIRDFRGLYPRSFDGRGNYSMGVREQIIFPGDRLRRDRPGARPGHHDHHLRAHRCGGLYAAHGAGDALLHLRPARGVRRGRRRQQRPGEHRLMAKTSLRVKQQRTPKYKTRAYTRCNRCGRPKAVYRKFGLCRICLRELAHNGQIPGMTKSSW